MTDAFGNALGESLAAVSSEANVKRAGYEARQAIGNDPVAFIRDTLIAGGTGINEATDAANNPSVNAPFFLAAAAAAAERQAGVNFNDLPFNQQNSVLREALSSSSGTLITDQINNPYSDYEPDTSNNVQTVPGNKPIERIEKPVTIIGGIDVKERFVHTAANVIETTNSAIATLVDSVGAPAATTTVFALQAAIGGIPKTAISFFLNKLTEPLRDYATEKLSGAIQKFAFDVDSFDNQDKRNDIKVVSDTLAGAGVGLVLDNAQNVARSSIAARTTLNDFASGLVATARGKLRTNLGLINPDYQAHHLITFAVARESDAIKYAAANLRYDINRVQNGIGLPKTADLSLKDNLPQHSGSHPEYSIAIGKLVKGLDTDFNLGKLSNTQLLARIADIESRGRNLVLQTIGKLK